MSFETEAPQGCDPNCRFKIMVNDLSEASRLSESPEGFTGLPNLELRATVCTAPCAVETFVSRVPRSALGVELQQIKEIGDQ